MAGSSSNGRACPRSWIDLIDLGFGVLGELSGLELLVQLNSLFSPKYRIVGGNDLLPRRMARRLGARVRYGTPVRAIEQTAGGVVVRYDGPGGSGTLRGDRAVVAVPLPVLRQMKEKRHAIGHTHYASVTRVYVQVNRRFWQDAGLSGFARTDHHMEIFDSSFGQSGERGVLMAYLHEGLARAVDGTGDDEGMRATVTMIQAAYPQLTDHVRGTTLFSWDREPWAGGAVALWRPGDFRDLYPHLASPAGRLYFAGEHCSPWHAWIQGAVHSGVRAAYEVNAA